MPERGEVYEIDDDASPDPAGSGPSATLLSTPAFVTAYGTPVSIAVMPAAEAMFTTLAVHFAEEARDVGKIPNDVNVGPPRRAEPP